MSALPLARGVFRPLPKIVERPLGCFWGLPVLALEVSMHAEGLRLRRAAQFLAMA